MSESITRRAFIGSAAAAAVAATSGRLFAVPAMPRRSVVVDAHVHCFAGPNNGRFPYHPNATYEPNYVQPVHVLLHLMNQTGVDYAIIVHPEPYQDDHSYLEYCLDHGGGRLKGTALVFADRPGSAEKLPDLVRRLPIVGVRIHAYLEDRMAPFGTPELRALWASATDLGIGVQLHFEPRYAAGFEPLIREFSQTPVVIDHLGRPFQGTPQEYETVLRWAQYPNTIIKMSAIPQQEEFPDRDIHEILARVISEWGVDRIISGGGFGANVTAATYPAFRNRLRDLLSQHLSAADIDKILGENAARLYGFVE